MEDKIPVLVSDQASGEPTKGIVDKARRTVYSVVDVDSARMRENIRGIIEKIESVLDGVEFQSKSYNLAEVQVSLEVTAEGSVALVGTVGATGSITLTFQRNP